MRRLLYTSISRVLPHLTLILLTCSASAETDQNQKTSIKELSGSSAAAPHAQSTRSAAQIVDEMLPFTGHSTNLPREVQIVASDPANHAAKYTSNLPIGPKGVKIPVQTVQVDSGRLDAVLKPSAIMRGVLIQAPDKILGVTTGGRMAVSVGEDTITIAALKGDVLVGQDGKFKPLEEGLLRVFDRATGRAQDVRRAAPATLSASAGLPLAMSGESRVRLKASVEDRELLVALLDPSGNPVGAIHKIAPHTPIEVNVPHAGVYYAVSRTVDKTGVYSQLSAPLRIQVLGLADGQQLPEDGIYLLDKGERLHLAGSEGLEMRYGTSSTFVPATASLGLYQNRPTEVEFRIPGDPKSAARIRIAPNILKTATELGPARAKWPGDPVHMRVSMWNGAGKLLSDMDQLAMEVTVNSQPVPVDWRFAPEEGLTAQLDELQGPGPWVVRLQVSDAQGHPVARDVLDVSAK